MAASHTVPHSSAVSQLPRHGTLCLFGFGVRVSVVNGNLSCHDGIGNERRAFLLSKVNSNLKRLVLISSDGFITLEAIRWIADRDAALVMLDRRGKVLAVCGPSAPSDARLRRAQALALGNGTALRISKELIRQKLEGQATLVRDMLQNAVAAHAIEKSRDELPGADSIESACIIEAQAAKQYWSAWADIPIRWPRKDERRMPDHWKRFGSRISPLTHSPRLAANPPNAILNLLYSVLEAEARIAAVAMGMDAGVGLLHVDAPSRDSLVFDILEPIRPRCDAFVLNWLQSEPLRKADFWEDRNGNCRLSSSLAIKLCETADTWRRLVAPVAEYIAQELWLKSSSKGERQLLATRLTQRHRREARGAPPIAPPEPTPPWEHICRGCGKSLTRGSTNCASCVVPVATQRLVEAARSGRVAAHTPEAEARRADTKRRHDAARRAWVESGQPAGLDKGTYIQKIQPLLARIPNSAIASALGVSLYYAVNIRKGRCCPHPRHWQALAELVGIATFE